MKIITSLYALMTLLLTLTLAPPVFATSVNLYDQPKADAKVIGSIDLATGVIPIFKSNDLKWVKVGDPRNGNVGWIKSSDIDSSSAFTYTQKVNNGKSQTEQTIQFGLLPTLTPKEREEMYKKIEIQQKNARDQMNNAMQNMLKEMNTFLQNFPLLLPGVVETPFKATQQPTKPAGAVTPAAPSTSATPPSTSTPATTPAATPKPGAAAPMPVAPTQSSATQPK